MVPGEKGNAGDEQERGGLDSAFRLVLSVFQAYTARDLWLMTPAAFRWHIEQAVEVKKEIPEIIGALLGVKTESVPGIKKEENPMAGLMKLSAMGFGMVKKCKR